MMKEEKQIPVSIQIKQIKETAFWLKELDGIVIDKPQEVKIDLSQALHFIAEKDLVECIITVSFFDPEEEQSILGITVNNQFIISGLKNFQDKKDPRLFNLPDNLAITITSLSVTHTRALLAKNASGTVYQNLYIPIVNPKELTLKLMKKAT